VVELDRGAIAAARKRYPGYLAVRAGLYAQGWNALAASAAAEPSH
jgi:hypothetical protein